MSETTGKQLHPSTAALLRFFEFEHLPTHLQPVSRRCHQLAHAMVEDLTEGPELTTGLRKLLEAKDCFVRASLPPAAPRPWSTESGVRFEQPK